MRTAIPVILIALTVAALVATWRRDKRKQKKRALAARNHPCARIPEWFYLGEKPSYDKVRLSATEELAFSRIAGGEEFAWITRALKAEREAER